MSDYADRLFEDMAEGLFPDIAPGPLPRYYPGSKTKIPPKPTPPPAPEKTWDRSPKKLKVKGVDREFFPIGAFAAAVNRKPVTIRSWEDKGFLPKSIYRHKERRLYSREQIEAVRALLDSLGMLVLTKRGESMPPAFAAGTRAIWADEVARFNTQG